MRLIRFINPNLRFFEGEDGGASGGAPADAGGDVNAGGQDQSQVDSEGINPNWNELLTLIPGQLHEAVKPHLAKWDKNFQTKLSEVQSQYEPLKQWEQFSDIDPEQVSMALQFYRIAEENPQGLLQQLQEYFGEGGQGQQGQEDAGSQEPVFDIEGDDILQHPKVQELLQNQEVLAQYLVQQQQQDQQRELEAQIDQEHEEIVKANPDFSEDDLVHMYEIATARNISLTEAAGIVKGYIENVAERRQAPHAPSVLPGTNGVVPAANNVDPRTLSTSDRKKLVVDILNQAREG